LIVNSKGGGHSFFGLYIAKELLNKGHTVAILNDGDKEKLKNKGPFAQYPELAKQGVEIVWGNPTDPSTYPKGPFDYVFDNNGKDMDSCKPLIDACTKARQLKNYVFIASAGAYNANRVEPMHVEGDPRKEKAGHVQVEKYLQSTKLPWTVFHPLYIYGPHTAKDCEHWFIDRISRDRPVPIPAPGVQLTSITHVEDIASMVVAVIGNDAAIRQHYNVASDRTITLTGIVNILAEAMYRDPKVLLYDPVKLGLGDGTKAKGFPFRTCHFFASVDKAKYDLGWTPKHDFITDAKVLVDAYKQSGRIIEDIDFSVDDKIIAAVGTK